MQAVQFDRDAMAAWYAEQHLESDPGVTSVYYLPTNAPEREIRLIEVNELLPEMKDEALEPLDFGVGIGQETEHKLYVLDVTPGQWERVKAAAILLPKGWSLDRAIVYSPN
jgi:hypothetical protein